MFSSPISATAGNSATAVASYIITVNTLLAIKLINKQLRKPGSLQFKHTPPVDYFFLQHINGTYQKPLPITVTAMKLLFKTLFQIKKKGVLGHLEKSQRWNNFSKNRPLGRFFHRVAMSVYISIYLSPFHVIFLRGRTGVDRHSSKNWCGASVAHAWSPKNKGWVQSVHRPRVEP